MAVGQQHEVLELGGEACVHRGQDVRAADPHAVGLLGLGPAQGGQPVGDVVEVDVVVDPHHLDRTAGGLGQQLPGDRGGGEAQLRLHGSGGRAEGRHR